MNSIANEQCGNLSENLNVFDDLVEPQTRRSRRKFATENSHVDLAIRKEISAEDLGGLAAVCRSVQQAQAVLTLSAVEEQTA